MDIYDFLVSEVGGALAVVAFVFGWFMKNLIPSEKINKYIPAVNAILCGTISAFVPEFYSGHSIPGSFILGAGVAALVSYGYDNIPALRKINLPGGDSGGEG